MTRTIRLVLTLFILIVPTFALMLRPGIYTMHDFHVFRQQQFNQCLSSHTFPCRWAPDSSKGYGQPLFNFYGQIPYWLGAIFGQLNFGVLASVKLTFILTMVGAALAMFAFARSEFGDRVGLLAAVIYSWAPYRAVDIWVRGALNEALAFVYYPLILWAAVRFVRTRKFVYAGWTSLLLALLLSTHNISFVMFMPFFGIVLLWEFWHHRNWHTVLDFLSIFLGTILLSAFYLFPIIAESGLITINSTTQGYYGYQLHWATLNQLLISRFWGFGGSTWGPNDGLSFAVGQVVWIPMVLLGIVLLAKRFRSEVFKPYLVFGALSLLALFLTHGKSELVWKLIPLLPFVQFPWRFLAIAVVFGSLVVGLWAKILPKIVVVLFIVLVIIQGIGQFRPDIWKVVTDNQFFSGSSWDEQRSSALTDFWPKSAKFIPDRFASPYPTVLYGSVQTSALTKIGPTAKFDADVTSDIAKIRLPIIYFPGWSAPVPIEIDAKTGLTDIFLEKGKQTINLEFVNTRPRTIGNVVSLASVVLLIILMRKYAQK